MTDKELTEAQEIHEHPLFIGSYHQAVWAYQWTSDSTNKKPLENCPIVCVICGRIKAILAKFSPLILDLLTKE